MLALLASAALLLAAPAPLGVGVFDVSAAGGEGASLGELPAALRQMGYEVGVITDLMPLTLLQYDVIYLSDMHAPGRVHEGWRQTLASYVADGGGVIQTWHHHVLSEVGIGIQRVYGDRGMKVVAPDHPAVRGVPATFQARYEDHIYEQVGQRGEVLITNDAGRPVVVAGTSGHGKVVSCGLALALAGGKRGAAPTGAEVPLLQAALEWLRPTMSRAERLTAALQTPQLEVSPGERLVAAGRSAVFEVLVGAAGAGEVTVEAPGAAVTVVASEPPLRRYRVTVPTAADSPTEQLYGVVATVGGQPLRARVAVKVVHGAPPTDEVRAVWLHVARDKHPSIVYPELKRLGINLAVLRIAGGTAAWYGSQVQPDVLDPLAPDGDWLAESVKHAHANGVRSYPYVNNVVVEGRSSPESLAALRAAGRLQSGPDGRPLDWFCPSQQANLEAIAAPMWELASRYDIDGLQYDFIRYPNAAGCFCKVCRERFERETGAAVATWPADVVDGPRHDAWVEFRCARISDLVKYVSTGVRQRNPKLKLSAAVFPDWPACRESIGQDWVRWCREGWLDEVFPMNYTLDPAVFAARSVVHRDAVPAGFRVIQGIGSDSGAGSMQGADELAVQIALARQTGSPGWCLFAWHPSHTTQLVEPLLPW